MPAVQALLDLFGEHPVGDFGSQDAEVHSLWQIQKVRRAQVTAFGNNDEDTQHTEETKETQHDEETKETQHAEETKETQQNAETKETKETNGPDVQVGPGGVKGGNGVTVVMGQNGLYGRQPGVDVDGNAQPSLPMIKMERVPGHEEGKEFGPLNMKVDVSNLSPPPPPPPPPPPEPEPSAHAPIEDVLKKLETKVMALESAVPMGPIAGQRAAGRGIKTTNWQDRLLLDRIEKAEQTVQQKLRAIEAQKQLEEVSKQPEKPDSQYLQQAVNSVQAARDGVASLTSTPSDQVTSIGTQLQGPPATPQWANANAQASEMLDRLAKEAAGAAKARHDLSSAARSLEAMLGRRDAQGNLLNVRTQESSFAGIGALLWKIQYPWHEEELCKAREQRLSGFLFDLHPKCVR